MRTILLACAVLALGCTGADRTPSRDAAGPVATGGAPSSTGGGGGLPGSGGQSGTGTGGAPSSTGGVPSSSDGPLPTADAAPSTDGASSSGDGAAGAPDGPAASMECSQPSIDRITWWQATGEGTTVPMKEGTSLLVKEGDHYLAREQFLKNEWHVLEVIITNVFGKSVDLSRSTGFTLTYNTTADLYIQLRPGFGYDGGDKWVILIPSSGGQDRTATFPFTGWTTIDELGKPSYTFARALAAAEGFVFVGKTPNTVTLKSLRIDGYTPACK
jgi:hypothetical protein